MHLRAGDVRRAHSSLGTTDAVVDQRRVLYAAIAELAAADSPDGGPLGTEELDNPAVRGYLGAFMSGHVPDGPIRCRPLSDLVEPAFGTTVAGHAVRLASSASAPTALAGALGRIGAELQRHDAGAPPPTLVTSADRATADSAFRLLVDGVRLAVDTAPDLALDLLPHIGLVAVLARDANGRLGSASAREFPGLIVIPEVRTALEIAEAVVHEGAHQKFFDLAMTRSMLADPHGGAPLFVPSWARSGAPGWPLEQAFAAWHAYCCLSAFADAVAGENFAAVPDSLLPVASRRAAELGDWLVEQGAYLGPDAHLLVEQMIDRSPVAGDVHADDRTWVSSLSEGRSRTVVHRCGATSLVVVAADVPALYWVSTEELDLVLSTGG